MTRAPGLPGDPGLAVPQSLGELFFAFNRLALQGFGGVLPVVQHELVERKRWLTQEEFVEDWAVAQIMPGPNVVNLALTLGARWFGLRGALARPGPGCLAGTAARRQSVGGGAPFEGPADLRAERADCLSVVRL